LIVNNWNGNAELLLNEPRVIAFAALAEIVTDAAADCVGLWILAATTVTVSGVGTTAGAV
jgi:hypothetical protein